MSMRKRKKVQILSREELRLRRWNFGLVPSERSLEAVGKSVRLHIIGRSNVFDLFPRTYKGKKRCVLRQKTRFDKFPRTNANLATHLTSIWSNRAMWKPSVCWRCGKGAVAGELHHPLCLGAAKLPVTCHWLKDKICKQIFECTKSVFYW